MTWWTRHSVKESDTGKEMDTEFKCDATVNDTKLRETNIDKGVKASPIEHHTEVVADVPASSTRKILKRPSCYTSFYNLQ